MDDYKDDDFILVADVDCIGAGKPLCQSRKVTSYPTLLWGDDPSSKLAAYREGREYATLQAFIRKNLSPKCSPRFPKLCDAHLIEAIAELKDLSEEQLVLRLGDVITQGHQVRQHSKAILDETLKPLQAQLDAINAEEEERGPSWDHLSRVKREDLERELESLLERQKDLIVDKSLTAEKRRELGAEINDARETLLKRFPKRHAADYDKAGLAKRKAAVLQWMRELRRQNAEAASAENPLLRFLQAELKRKRGYVTKISYREDEMNVPKARRKEEL